MKSFVLATLLCLSAQASAAALKDLPAKEIAALKKGSCTFIHVWATWCSPCLKEMPDLLRTLTELKQVKPIIIDISSPGVQKGFSRKWMQTLKPPFPVYFKPPGNDKKYYAAIDKFWPGGLPYSALYHGGKQRHVWIGEIDFEKLKAAVTKECR